MTKTKHHRICYSFESILHKINRFSILTGTIRGTIETWNRYFQFINVATSCFVDLLSADAYAFTHIGHWYTERVLSITERWTSSFVISPMYSAPILKIIFQTRISVRVCPLRGNAKVENERKNENSIPFVIECSQRGRFSLRLYTFFDEFPIF